MKALCIGLAVLLPFLLLTANVSAQTNYMLSSGGPVAGGGAAGSPSYKISGAVPIAGAVYATSPSYALTGGIVAGVAEAPFSASYVGPPVDTVSPASRTIKVVFSTSALATTGAIYYRFGGASTYLTRSMTDAAGDTLTYQISADMLGIRGLEYYFTVTQGPATVQIGSSTEPFVFVTSLNNSQTQRPSALEGAKYRIVGLPLQVTGTNTVASVFGDDFGTYDKKKWRLGSYLPASDTVVEYPDGARVLPGQGFWLIMRTPDSYGADGQSVYPNNHDFDQPFFKIPLDSGWNQLANPYAFPISWAQVGFGMGDTLVTGHPSGILDDFAYWYSGSAYSSVTTIPAWDGFFVFIKKPDVYAYFPCRETAAPAAAKPLADMDEAPVGGWDLHLRLDAQGLIDDGNWIGVRPDASVGEDEYDFFEPPPAPDAPRLAFQLPDGISGLRRADYRAPLTDGAQWKMVVSAASERTITFTGLDNVPGGMSAALVLDDGAVILPAESSPIRLPDQTRSATLLIGTKTYLEQESGGPIPTDYALDQNHPNPFNPITSISFAIPENQHVHLAVYNILGQLVRTLADEELAAGRYVRLWNGDDNFGRAVASGIYFYRLNAGKFTQCRKMALLK